MVAMWFQQIKRTFHANRHLLLAGGLLAAYCIFVALARSTQLEGWLGLGLLISARGIVVAGLFSVIRSAQRPRFDFFLQFTGVAFLLWVAADLFAGLAWIPDIPLNPAPNWSDLFRVAGYAAFMAAILNFPRSSRERFGRYQDLVELAILALIIGSMIWLILLRPVWEIGFADAVAMGWSAVPIFCDLFAIFACLRHALLSGPDPSQRRLASFLAGGFFFFLPGNLYAGYSLLQLQQPAFPWVAAMWIAANLLIWEALRGFQTRSLDKQIDPGRFGERGHWDTFIILSASYFVVGFSAVDWWYRQRMDRVALLLMVLLGVLLVARQGILLGQRELRQFAALLDATMDLAFLCTSDGVVQFANPALRRMLILPAELPQGLRLHDFLQSDQNMDEMIDLALREGWAGDMDLRRSDGSIVPVALSLQPILDQRSGAQLLSGTAHDLSEIKTRERELRQALSQVAHARRDLEDLNAQLEDRVAERTLDLRNMIQDLERLNDELKDLDRLKTEFLALVSHELRTPLTNIRMGIELMRKTRGDERLMLIQQEVHRLSHLVENILDISALEAGRMQLDCGPIQVEREVTAALKPFEQREGFARISNHIAPDLPPAHADPQGFRSILFHLLDNALKYAPEGEILVEAQRQDEGIMISVSDRGPGIPAGEQGRVFEMFHRLDTRDDRETYGHGLGLPMTKRLVEAMGGWIAVRNRGLGGAQFRFWLPISSGE